MTRAYLRVKDESGVVHSIEAIKGDKGETYELTQQDKIDIAALVPGSSYDDTEIKNRLNTIEGKESGWDAKANLSDIPSIPTNVSAFTNDAGYLTTHQSLANYALKSEIPTVPTNVSSFTNDSGYLTEHQSLSEYAKTTDIPSDEHINGLIDAKIEDIPGGGSSVSVNQTLTSGTEIGSITVNGTETKLYAPNGGNVTDKFSYSYLSDEHDGVLITQTDTITGGLNNTNVYALPDCDLEYLFDNKISKLNVSFVPASYNQEVNYTCELNEQSEIYEFIQNYTVMPFYISVDGFCMVPFGSASEPESFSKFVIEEVDTGLNLTEYNYEDITKNLFFDNYETLQRVELSMNLNAESLSETIGVYVFDVDDVQLKNVNTECSVEFYIQWDDSGISSELDNVEAEVYEGSYFVEEGFFPEEYSDYTFIDYWDDDAEIEYGIILELNQLYCIMNDKVTVNYVYFSESKKVGAQVKLDRGLDFFSNYDSPGRDGTNTRPMITLSVDSDYVNGLIDAKIGTGSSDDTVRLAKVSEVTSMINEALGVIENGSY